MMPQTLVQTQADSIGHSRRPASVHIRPHSGSRSRAAAGHPKPDVRRSDKQASTIRAAVLEERARIGRELHDSVTQTLYAISIAASRARTLLQRNDTEQGQRIVEEVLRLASAGQAEVRALLTEIRSDAPMFEGLVGALEKLAADVETRHALDVRLSAVEEPMLPAQTAEALVLIAREALHNVTKHAAARRIDIVLEDQHDELVMLITDDGRGFDPATPCPGHFGLRSMRERAVSAGGALTLFSTAGHGTQLCVSLPLCARTHG